MAKTEDLRQKSDDQLAEELTTLKREQFNLRFNVIADRFSMMLKDRYDRKLEADNKKKAPKDA